MDCSTSAQPGDRHSSCEPELPGAFEELCTGDLESPNCEVSWLTLVGVGAIEWLWIMVSTLRLLGLPAEALASREMACGG